MRRERGKAIQLFIATQERLFRDAVLLELVQQPDVRLVGEAARGREVLSQLDHSAATTLIIEENLPDVDGLTVSEMALARLPLLSIILLVDQPVSENRLAIYLEAGIKSVVPKTLPLRSLHEAIHYTRNGQPYVLMPSSHTDRREPCIDLSLYDALSSREQEVARHIANHQSTRDIADQLKVSSKTVHTYKERILVKLGCQKLPEMQVYMRRLAYHQAKGTH